MQFANNLICEGFIPQKSYNLTSVIQRKDVADITKNMNIKSPPVVSSPNRIATRAEAYALVMASVCMNTTPSDNTDWQTSVYTMAVKNGLTLRSADDFEANEPILRQDLFVITARAADWAEKTGGCNPKPLDCEK